MSPPYSATLLVARPMPGGALGQHLAGRRRRARRRRSRPDPGCRATRRRPRRSDAAHGRTAHRPDSAVRTMIRPHSSWRSTSSGGADADAPTSRCSSGPGGSRRSGRGRSRRPPTPPSDGAELLVQREQVGRAASAASSARSAAVRSSSASISAKAASRAALGRGRGRRGGPRAGPASSVELGLRGLGPLHHLELAVLEVGLRAGPGSRPRARGPAAAWRRVMAPEASRLLVAVACGRGPARSPARTWPARGRGRTPRSRPGRCRRAGRRPGRRAAPSRPARAASGGGAPAGPARCRGPAAPAGGAGRTGRPSRAELLAGVRPGVGDVRRHDGLHRSGGGQRAGRRRPATATRSPSARRRAAPAPPAPRWPGGGAGRR